MLWRLFNRRDPRFASERFCHEHSCWLTHAMLSGKHYPRIPTRLASSGGFSELMAQTEGPIRAERWWDAAIERAGSSD